MDQLSRLIKDRMAEQGWTYDEVCRNARERGYKLPKSTIYHLATKTEHRQAPRVTTLKAVAAGLRYPEDVLFEAAADQAGYRLVEIPTTLKSAGTLRIIAAAHDDLEPEQQEALARMAEQYAEQMRKARQRGDVAEA